MPAQKLNYICLYKHSSQVFGTATKSIALESPPPPGAELEDKRVFFITYQPDEEELSVHRLPDDEVQNADIKYKKPKKKEDDA